MSHEPGYTLEVTDWQLAELGSPLAFVQFMTGKGLRFAPGQPWPVCPICYNGSASGFSILYYPDRCVTVYRCNPESHAEYYAWHERQETFE